MTKYYRTTPVTDKELGHAINVLHFKSYVYYDNDSYDRLFEMTNDVRDICGMPPMTRDKFDEGIQYRHPFATPYHYGMTEFKRLCNIDW